MSILEEVKKELETARIERELQQRFLAYNNLKRIIKEAIINKERCIYFFVLKNEKESFCQKIKEDDWVRNVSYKVQIGEYEHSHIQTEDLNVWNDGEFVVLKL